ncbi:hypothetical protein K449DRAFT_439079 [Hypoxylon sp. EC38]|nr:hypothetical protein K449DRAFT_439079 [Hypoxylon sp. EC38]
MQLHTVALDKSAAKVDVVLSRSGSRLNPLTSCSRASRVGPLIYIPQGVSRGIVGSFKIRLGTDSTSRLRETLTWRGVSGIQVTSKRSKSRLLCGFLKGLRTTEQSSYVWICPLTGTDKLPSKGELFLLLFAVSVSLKPLFQRRWIRRTAIGRITPLFPHISSRVLVVFDLEYWYHVTIKLELLVGPCRITTTCGPARPSGVFWKSSARMWCGNVIATAEVDLGALQAAEKAGSHWIMPGGLQGSGHSRIRLVRPAHPSPKEGMGMSVMASLRIYHELRYDQVSTMSYHLATRARTSNPSSGRS